MRIFVRIVRGRSSGNEFIPYQGRILEVNEVTDHREYPVICITVVSNGELHRMAYRVDEVEESTGPEFINQQQFGSPF
jgi:hypothetical protein